MSSNTNSTAAKATHRWSHTLESTCLHLPMPTEEWDGPGLGHAGSRDSLAWTATRSPGVWLQVHKKGSRALGKKEESLGGRSHLCLSSTSSPPPPGRASTHVSEASPKAVPGPPARTDGVTSTEPSALPERCQTVPSQRAECPSCHPQHQAALPVLRAAHGIPCCCSSPSANHPCQA